MVRGKSIVFRLGRSLINFGLMLNRYAIFEDPSNGQLKDWTPSYNASPTSKQPVLTSDGLTYMYWGRMAKWANNKSMSPKLHNTYLDDDFQKPSLLRALKNGRCIVPANGYFIWQQIGKKQQTPHFYYLGKNDLFGIAGLWEQGEDLEGNEYLCFLLLASKTEAGDKPIAFGKNKFDEWLNLETPFESIISTIKESQKTQFISHPANPAISNPSNNSSSLIKASNPADQHGNYTLF